MNNFKRKMRNLVINIIKLVKKYMAKAFKHGKIFSKNVIIIAKDNKVLTAIATVCIMFLMLIFISQIKVNNATDCAIEVGATDTAITYSKQGLLVRPDTINKIYSEAEVEKEQKDALAHEIKGVTLNIDALIDSTYDFNEEEKALFDEQITIYNETKEVYEASNKTFEIMETYLIDVTKILDEMTSVIQMNEDRINYSSVAAGTLPTFEDDSYVGTSNEEAVTYEKVDHYASNGEKTGTTTYGYDANGELSYIDAQTYYTPYSQQQEEYMAYDCEGTWTDLKDNGCVVNSFSMMYSVYSPEELTPIEIYEQGYDCNLIDNNAYENLAAENGMYAESVKPVANVETQNPTFENTNGIVPNGKDTFTVAEALVDYGMPVQIWFDFSDTGNTIHPTGNHSVILTRYTWENGDATVYMADPNKPEVYERDVNDYKIYAPGSVSKAWVMKPAE